MKVDLPDISHLPWRTRWKIRFFWAFGFRASASLDWPDWKSPWWFNVGIGTLHFYFPPLWGLPGLCIFPLVAFNRVYEEPEHNCWGFGLLQANCRYLIGIVSNEEKFQVDLGFVHLHLVDRCRERAKP